MLESSASYTQPSEQPPRKIEVVSADPDTIRLFCPESDAYVTFSLLFPDNFSYESFITSLRTREDATKNRGRLYVIEPNAIVAERDTNANEEGVINQPISVTAGEVGITVEEYEEARELAWKTLIDNYRAKLS